MLQSAHPLVIAHVIEAEALRRVDTEHPLSKIERARASRILRPLGNGIGLPAADFGSELGDLFVRVLAATKRQLRRKHGKEANASRPHVRACGEVLRAAALLISGMNLRRGV